MQIANGTVIISPENHQYKRGITPAEALILKELHFLYSNGSPLGNDFVIQKEEAVTVDQEEKAAESGYFNQGSGRHVDPTPYVPAVTHKRTNAEECARLRKKYTGNIVKNGVSMPAFAAVFGTAPNIKLPETFEEIQEALGIPIHTEEIQNNTGRAFDLSKKGRPELVEMANSLKIMISAGDSKDYIIAAIINAEAKAAQPEVPARRGRPPTVATE